MRRFLGCCLLAPMLAVAANNKPLELDKIVSQQQQIRSAVLSSNGKYRGLAPAKQTELLQRQDALLRMIEGKQTSDDLTQKERISAFNDLEWIEATLNNVEGERMICRREKRVGSNRITEVCRTAEQMEIDRERAREELDHTDRNMRLGG